MTTEELVTKKDPKDYVLYVEDLYKIYGDKCVLDNIDVRVRPGEFCTVVGPSGCGKSTLLKIILGQEYKTSGIVLINGKEVGFPDVDRGIVYQNYNVYPNLSAIDNVLLGPRLGIGLLRSAISRKRLREESMEYLKRMRLEEHVNKMPHELSGGQLQRVAIAQALVKKPKILLMDEPFGALDPMTREMMQVFILELWEEHKMTILFVTHDPREALFLGTRLFAISQYYTDGRGNGSDIKRGARIVCDYKLPRTAAATSVKYTDEFLAIEQEIRQIGDPKHLTHVRNFNLRHPDSFQTLTSEEAM